MGTTTELVLDERLSKLIGDWIEEDTTTNIGAGTSVISTALKKWDYGSDDYFNDWWIYITESNNLGVERRISDYATATGTITVQGANLTAETGTVTFRVYRYSWNNKLRALNDAIRELYPELHRPIDNRELITGNILPPFNWTSSSALQFYTTSSITLAKTTTSGLFWNGHSSAKATAGAGNGYITLKSDNYTRLLDAMGAGVTGKVWANPETADDAAIVIYTKKADGTTQTLTSTTSNPAAEFSLLEKEDQTLNDDLVEVEVRLKITTDAKYVYFSPPRLIGIDVYEYLLPYDLQTGHVSQVYIQTEGYSEDICDDLLPTRWDRAFGYEIIDDGTYKWLRLPNLYVAPRQIRLIGDTHFEIMDDQADTISTSDERKLNLLLAYSAFCLFRMEEGVPSPQDIRRVETNVAKWYAYYKRLSTGQRMMRPSQTMNIAGWKD